MASWGFQAGVWVSGELAMLSSRLMNNHKEQKTPRSGPHTPSGHHDTWTIAFLEVLRMSPEEALSCVAAGL